jgi:cell division protein FtsZ
VDSTGAAGAAEEKRMIIAVGCAGGRIAEKLGLPFAAINTDWRELGRINASIHLPIGSGLGAGNPVTGKLAAEKATKEIAKLCMGPVMIVAGLGGGTGGGATHVVARVASRQGCDVSMVLIWPLYFEGRERLQRAKKRLAVLRKYKPVVVVWLPELLPLPPGTSIKDVFAASDDKAVKVLIDMVKGKSMAEMDAAAWKYPGGA